MAPPPGPGYAPMAYAYYAPAAETERRTQVDRTKAGILLLVIGAALAWLPNAFAQIGGYLMVFIGAILVFAGRKAFGSPHPRNAGISFALILSGLVGIIAVLVFFGLAFLSALARAVFDPVGAVNAMVAALNIFLIGQIVIIAIFGLALVLVTYSLQKSIGRILLWAAYGTGLGVQAAIFAVIYLAIQDLLAGVITSGSVDAVQALVDQSGSLGLLSVISWALFAVAYFLAWQRISKGEIPEKAGAPAAVVPMPPFPTPPPPSPPPSGP